MATPEMLQPAVQLIELDQDRLHVNRANKLGIRQDVSSIFGKKYKPKIIISTPSGPAGEGGQGGTDAPRPFACMFCPAAFKTESALVSHVRVHVTSGVGVGGAKQIVHSCVYCNRSFKQATNLEIHVRTYHPYGDGSSGGPQQLNNYNMNQAALNASYRMNQAGLALWEYRNQEQQQGEGNSGEGQNNSHEQNTQVKQEKGTGQQQFGPDASGATVSWEKVSRDLSTAYAVERPFTCDYCSKCFKQEAHLKQHVRVHTDDRPYACAFCGKAFRQKAVLNQHVRLHTGEKPYACAHCGDRFRQMTTLKLHTRKHLCEVVASGSLVGSGYRDIIRIMKGAGMTGGGGGGGPPLSEHEEAANVLSAQIAQMQAAAGGHVNGMPKGPGRGGGNVGRPRGSHRPPDTLYYLERPYTCAHCHKCFKQEAHLKLHERTHSDYRPFACGYCGKAFRLKAILQQHERLHTGEKPYACAHCGESFRQMTTLKLHARKHEVALALARGETLAQPGGGGENQHAVSPRDIHAYQVERPHRCPYCIKSFKQATHLKQHLRIHSDEKPYECTYCARRFRQKAVLNQHVRLHTGEKPYVCVQCGNTYRQLTNLKSHLNTCTGEPQPYLAVHSIWGNKNGENSKPKRGRKCMPQNQYIKLEEGMEANEKVSQWLKADQSQRLCHDQGTSNNEGNSGNPDKPQSPASVSRSLWSKAMFLETASKSLQQHWSASAGGKELGNTISGVALWEHSRAMQQQQQQASENS